MSHVAANNEIIRMRPTVRKSRVGVVWKLTKELRLLKNRKHGDEKILSKCKKKSEKLIKEIKAIKRLKDDDIAKFAILNTRSLQEVLNDPKVDRKTRVMTKLAFHKHLKSSVDKFREKFPHYKLGKRQLAKSELKKPLGIETSSVLIDKNEKSLNNDEEKSENKRGESDDSEENEENEENDLETESDEESEEENNSRTKENSDGFSEEKKIEKTSENLRENKRKLEVNKSETFEISTNKTKDTSISNLKKTREDESSEEFSGCKNENLEKSKSPIEKFSNNELNLVEYNEKTFSSKRTKKLKKCKEQNNLNIEIPSTEKIYEKTKKPKKSRESNNANIVIPLNGEIPERKIKFVSNVATVKRLKIGESLEESEVTLESNEIMNLPSSDEKVDLDREVDSFFISSSDGGAYRSVIVPKLNPSMDDGDRDENFGRRKFKPRNSLDQGQKEGNFRGKVDFKKNRRDFRSNESISDKSTNRRDKFVDRSGDKTEENLHPSWAAKKKQQEILKHGFQGKKIVFNDD